MMLQCKLNIIHDIAAPSHPNKTSYASYSISPHPRQHRCSHITDVSSKDLGLDQVSRHQVHVLDTDLHEGFHTLPCKAHQPALECTHRAILVGWVHDSLVSSNVSQTAQMHVVERGSIGRDACRQGICHSLPLLRILLTISGQAVAHLGESSVMLLHIAAAQHTSGLLSWSAQEADQQTAIKGSPGTPSTSWDELHDYLHLMELNSRQGACGGV